MKLAIYFHLQQMLRMRGFLSPFPDKSSSHMACFLKGQFYIHPSNPEHSQLFIKDADGATKGATVKILFRLKLRNYSMSAEIYRLLPIFCFRGFLLLQSAMGSWSLYVFINSQGGKINFFFHSFHPLVCHNSARCVQKLHNFNAP